MLYKPLKVASDSTVKNRHRLVSSKDCFVVRLSKQVCNCSLFETFEDFPLDD